MPVSSELRQSRTIIRGNEQIEQRLYPLSIKLDNYSINFKSTCIFSDRAEIYASVSSDKLNINLNHLQTKTNIIQQLLEKIPRIEKYLLTSPATDPANFTFIIHDKKMLAVTFNLREPLKYNGLAIYPNYDEILNALCDVTTEDKKESKYDLIDWLCPRDLLDDEIWESFRKLNVEFHSLPIPENQPDPFLTEKKLATEMITLISFEVEKLRIAYNSREKEFNKNLVKNKNLLKSFYTLTKSTCTLFVYLDTAKTVEEKNQAFRKYREDVSPIIKPDNLDNQFNWDTDNQLSNIKKLISDLIINFSKIEYLKFDGPIDQLFRSWDEEYRLFPKLNENHIKPLTADQLPSIKKSVDEITTALSAETEKMRTDHSLGKQINTLLLAKYKLIIKTTRILFENLETAINDNVREHCLKTYRKELMPVLNSDWAEAEQLSKVKKLILKLITKLSILFAKKDQKEAAEERAVRWGAKILKKPPTLVSTTLNYMGLFKRQLELSNTLELVKEFASKNIKNSYHK